MCKAGFLRCVFAVSFLGIPISCSNSGDNPSPNLKVGTVKVVSQSLQVAHPVKVETTISSASDVQDAVVSYRLLRRQDLDAGKDPIEQYVLGELVTNLPRGDTVHQVDLVIPKVQNPGAYYLVAEVDPHKQVTETDETDNIHKEDVDVQLGAEYANMPNVVLEELSFTPTVITIPKYDSLAWTWQCSDPNLHTRFGATLVASATGSQTVTGVEIGLSDLQVVIDGDSYDLSDLPFISSEDLKRASVWASGGVNGFKQAYTMDIVPGQKKSLYLDACIPQGVLKAISWGMQWYGVSEIEFTVTVMLDPLDKIREYELTDDNSKTATFTIELEPDPVYYYEKNYDKGFKNSNFGAGIEFHADVGLSRNGVKAVSEAGVPITLFGKTFKFLELQGDASRNPYRTYSDFQVSIRFLGLTIYHTELSTDTLKNGLPVNYTLSQDKGGFSFSKSGGPGVVEWSVSKEKEQKKTFFPGGFPITVRGAVGGEIGFKAQVTSTDTFTLTAGPFADLYGSAEGGAGAGIEVGIGGQLIFLKDYFHPEVYVAMRKAGVSPNRTIECQVGFKVVNTITALDGRIYLYAKYPWCDLCWEVILPYPCHCGMRRAELDIVNWNGFTISNETLYELKSQAASVPVED